MTTFAEVLSVVHTPISARSTAYSSLGDIEVRGFNGETDSYEFQSTNARGRTG